MDLTMAGLPSISTAGSSSFERDVVHGFEGIVIIPQIVLGVIL
jgi:hypothetical protein